MNRNTIATCKYLLIIAVLATPAFAMPSTGTSSELSGSYKIIQKIEKNGETRVQLQIQFANRSLRDLHIQRITLWDFSHPSKGGTRACSVTVPSSASVSTVQEFTLSRAELELWQRGTRPRIVLNLASPNRRPSTVTMRLEPVPARNGR